jgi:hypothetical protein
MPVAGVERTRDDGLGARNGGWVARTTHEGQETHTPCPHPSSPTYPKLAGSMDGVVLGLLSTVSLREKEGSSAIPEAARGCWPWCMWIGPSATISPAGKTSLLQPGWLPSLLTDVHRDWLTGAGLLEQEEHRRGRTERRGRNDRGLLLGYSISQARLWPAVPLAVLWSR